MTVPGRPAGNATLYTSPGLGEYNYQPFKGYSPPIKVEVRGVGASNDKPLKLAFVVQVCQCSAAQCVCVCICV